ncbi:MAG: ABC transporter ATP-binding protein [Deltaproteobacteria bacterium]|nr:ABC transporter ATP-binding protein [Deltaproteobacteria bacterium]
MSVAAASLTWPRARLGEAMTAINTELRGVDELRTLANPAPDVIAGPPLDRWVQAGVHRLGLAVDAPDQRARGLSDLLPEASAIIARCLSAETEEGAYLVVVGPLPATSHTARVLTPNGAVYVDVSQLEHALFAANATQVVAELGLPRKQRLAAERAMRAALGGGALAEAWVIEDAAPTFWQRARRLGAARLLLTGLAGFIGQLALFSGAWGMVANGALQGRLESGTLWAFGLLLATMVGVRAVAGSALGRAVVLLSGLARERLLEGILRLDGGEIRARGVGQLLGTVLEVDSLELLARGGGPTLIWVVLDLVLGASLLALGAGGVIHFVLLVLWLVLLAWWLRGLQRRLTAWTDARLTVTHELVEAMVGHRTLVAQDQGLHLGHLHASLDEYQERSWLLDQAATKLTAILPRGWVVLGLLGLVPAFVDRGTSSAALATALGGVVLIWGAFRHLAEASPALTAAFVAWRNLRFLFSAAQRGVASSADVLAASPDEAAVGRRGLMVGRDVVFRYEGRPEAVLRGCNFSIRRHERVLLEGGSGGGKSTLGAILSGLRVPTSGVLLLGGFDHHAVGPQRWRQRSGGVPQFHDNHIFAGPLLFNLLLGRRWPPRQEDIAAADAVCRELGLGPLLDRMPAGLNQTVGDSGWQLSHGERSRVFVARSLLQRVDVRVFDESLAALDPETSLRVLQALLGRPEALVLIAHR